MITSEDSDEEIEQSLPMEIEQSASDQSSTSNSQSISLNSQPTNNLQIEPIAAPRPTKLPS